MQNFDFSFLIMLSVAQTR